MGKTRGTEHCGRGGEQHHEVQVERARETLEQHRALDLWAQHGADLFAAKCDNRRNARIRGCMNDPAQRRSLLDQANQMRPKRRFIGHVTCKRYDPGTRCLDIPHGLRAQIGVAAEQRDMPRAVRRHPARNKETQPAEPAGDEIRGVAKKLQRAIGRNLRRQQAGYETLAVAPCDLVFAAAGIDCSQQGPGEIRRRTLRGQIQKSAPVAGMFECKHASESQERSLPARARQHLARDRLGALSDEPRA